MYKTPRMLVQALEDRQKYSDDFVQELYTVLTRWGCLSREYEEKLNTMDVFDELAKFRWYHDYIEGLYGVDDGRYRYDVEGVTVQPPAMTGIEDGYGKLQTYAAAKEAADRGSF
jgi:hypothetical protein